MSQADGPSAAGPGACPRHVHPAPTSIAGFLGTTSRGPTDRPAVVDSLRDFTDRYGPVTSEHPLTRSVELFFRNGGVKAGICRVDPEGGRLDESHLIDPALATRRAGLWLLDRLDAVNLLCIPPFTVDREVTSPTWQAAATYAKARGAMLLLDAPRSGAAGGEADASLMEALVPDAEVRMNCVLYRPWLQPEARPDVDDNPPLPPSGAVAGLYARMDATRGVWVAPAGRDAVLHGIAGLHPADADTDVDDGIAALGANAIRQLDVASAP
ncbi:MAG TPA: hypothetical protein VMF13_07335, partial [Luteitalea sp.]|nr:hypothetical protein [Luteitalea sp.]